MSQETLGYVELEWTCKRCGSKNPGTTKTCASCGNPMSEKDQFEAPVQQQLLTDKGELAKAQVGPDVHCKYCGARNPADAKNCKQCGADLTGASSREAGRVVGAFQSGPVPDVKCPSCGALNPARSLKCKQCGSSLSAPAKSASARAATPARSGGIGIVGLIALAAIGLFVFLLTRSSDAAARVESVHWERSVTIMALRPVEREDWADLIPKDGLKGQCIEKVRVTQPEPAPNADKVCGTPYTVDQGNGTAKVVQDCQYQVKAQWCAYTRDELTQVDAVVAQGSDLKPRWPEMSLKSGEREGERAETYEIGFNSDGKQYNYAVNTAEEFAQFTPGSRWTLKVNGLGGVTDAQPAR
jgi:ribosomal protein L40E